MYTYWLHVYTYYSRGRSLEAEDSSLNGSGGSSLYFTMGNEWYFTHYPFTLQYSFLKGTDANANCLPLVKCIWWMMDDGGLGRGRGLAVLRPFFTHLIGIPSLYEITQRWGRIPTIFVWINIPTATSESQHVNSKDKTITYQKAQGVNWAGAKGSRDQ